MTLVDRNAVDFKHILEPECYVPCILSFLSWSTLNLITSRFIIPQYISPKFEHIKNSLKLQFKISTQVTSVIHGLAIGYLSLIWLSDILKMTISEQDVLSKTTAMQRIWLSVGIGYFIYDILFYCIIGSLKHSGKVDKVYFIHHTICIFIWGYSAISLYGGMISMIVIWLHEWTNPLLAAILFQNYFTRNRKEYNSLKWQFILKIAYWIPFNVMRFGFGLRISWQLVFEYDSPLYLEISVPLLILLNTIFSVVLFQDLCKVYGQWRKAAKGKTEGFNDTEKPKTDNKKEQ